MRQAARGDGLQGAHPSKIRTTRPTQEIFMHATSALIVMTLLATCACGCSRGGDTDAAAPASAVMPASSAQTGKVTSVAPTGPVDNACDLLTDAEVRQAFPKAESGKRNTASLQYGLDRCAWETPTGQIGVEVSKVEAAAFAQELRAELQGAVDPRVQGALDRIQFHPIEGIGDHAIAVLEKGDAKRGIYADITLLAIQRGHRMAVLMLREDSSDAPQPTLESLQGLGRQLAPRL